MARYERDFLVPYLEDICALHLSKKRVSEMIASLNTKIDTINQHALDGITPPQFESYKNESDLVGLGTGFTGLIFFGLSIFLFFYVLVNFDSPISLLLPLGTSLIGWHFINKSNAATDTINEEIKKRNDDKENNYQIAQMAVLASTKPQVEIIKEQISVLKNELVKIDELLEQMYNVNIIPRWYRDIYPAVYLYDWFSNSRADDLDLALNTLVLEQIKERLDTIITNQEDIIINQRITIANQRSTMSMLEEHHNIMMNKLNSLEVSIKDHKMYLHMIEANTAANAYFSAANYLRR